jgi:hypothetical protein
MTTPEFDAKLYTVRGIKQRSLNIPVLVLPNASDFTPQADASFVYGCERLLFASARKQKEVLALWVAAAIQQTGMEERYLGQMMTTTINAFGGASQRGPNPNGGVAVITLSAPRKAFLELYRAEPETVVVNPYSSESTEELS